MRIRTSGVTPRAASNRSPRTGRRVGVILAGLVTLVLYSAIMLVLGMALFRAVQPRSPELDVATRVAVGELPAAFLDAAKNHLEALRREDPLERLHLDIAFEDLEKIRAKRLEALRLGTLIASDDDFVAATIRHDGRSIRTKIRLKGDLLDHLYGDKWSFRVHVRKSDHLFGMRRFSIQSPRVRDYQTEPIFLAHLRREGILTPRYLFVELVVNGKDIGVMAVEEHFSKELLESQQRKEGLLLRFDESRFWMNRYLNGTFGPFANPQVASLRPFRSSKVAKSALLTADLPAAVGLMRSFLAGDLAPREVFDVELMARFMAIAEVWNAHHALAWHNLRFYFNPLTARLEPVVFDGHLQARPLEPGLIAQTGAFTHLLLEDDEFRDRFVHVLARISGEMADGTLVSWAREQENEIVPRIQEGLEHIAPLRMESLIKRARITEKIGTRRFEHYLPPLGSPEMVYPEPLEVFLCGNCTPTSIEFVNALPVPVSVLALNVSGKSDDAARMAEVIAAIEFPLEVPATEFMGVPTPLRVAIGVAVDSKKMKVDATIRVADQEQRQEIRAKPYYDRMATSPIPVVSLSEALARHPFLKLDDEGGNLRVDAGDWDVQGSLVIPEEMGLELGAGVELRFAEGEALISSGPLLFRGTEDDPVILKPSQGHETWAGVAGVRSKDPHVWQYVVVESTSGLTRPGWRLTGGVTLRASEVQIANSVFRGHRGEDALNLIRTRFELENVEFQDVPSDALDADFSNGVIRGGRFSMIGGDGIDVSGAEIEVDGVELFDIADKAISVGEGSRVQVRNVRVERVGTGAASKDRSTLVLEDSTITDALTAAVTVYTKKPEYGPASAILNRVEMKNVGAEVLVQTGSRAVLDGESVPETPLDTASLY